MTTTALRLRACPRCAEKLRVTHDIHGGYLYCLQCGHHSYADVPPEARIARPEAMAAYHTVFEYAGPQKSFQGYRLRGRLLPRGRNQTTESFDLLCPYAGCQRRQRRQGKNTRDYWCKTGHSIRLDLNEMRWQ
ncbi:hypothetical protein LCGC14_1167700 [marine sediment metagenome]|uniref:Uncharacterized protein n=1 Tax=marine sediment metagenome TaxID=412755 RepID=A0A0F9P8V2_9ZZZZ